MYPVYLITCFHPSYGQNVMPYVGVVVTKGKTILDRFRGHTKQCKSSTSYLGRAIKKYGKEWFTVEQIDAGNTPEQALELEKWWIKRLGAKHPTGYNLTDGGEGGATVTGRKLWHLTRPTEETMVRQQPRAARKQSEKPAWKRMGCGSGHGTTRQLTLPFPTPNPKKGIRGNQHVLGKHWKLSAETRQRQSAAQTGRTFSPESIRRMREGQARRIERERAS